MSETFIVETHARGTTPGQQVTLVFYSEGHPWVIHAHVATSNPFVVETTDANVLQLESERKVVLISHDEDGVAKAEAVVSGLERANFGWRIKIANLAWETSDRRRYPRYACRIPVTIRRVDESLGGDARFLETRGETEDLSYGGAWVKARDLLEQGMLVEFRAILSETESVRALAVVVHSNPIRGGMGLEFVDYISGTRTQLASFLSRAA